jgi:lysophospholipase L1-like esterase
MSGTKALITALLLTLGAALSVPALALTVAAAAPAAAAAGPDLVALGDSIADGTNCDCTPYPSLVGAELSGTAADGSARVANLAHAGWTSANVLSQVRGSSAASAIAGAHYVTIEIGANDFDSGIVTNSACTPPAMSCYRPQLATLRRNLDAIVSRVQALQRRSGATIVLMGYWNVFTDGQAGYVKGPTYVRNSDYLSRAVNWVVADVARLHHVLYANAYKQFKGDRGGYDPTWALSSDGMHPNYKGHLRLKLAIMVILRAAGRA